MVKENLAEVKKEVEAAVAAAGRKKGSVALMAVSKLHTWENIMEAYEAGQRLFGENHVQEVEAKFPKTRPEGMEVHLIGHLQGNKVGKIVPLVDAIDSVDSLKLLRHIDHTAAMDGRVMPVLLEFNTSGEEAKSGFLTEEDLFAALDAAAGLQNVKIEGLMTVGPLGGDEEKNREAFSRLTRLRDECRKRYPLLCFDTLSMGMSDDFPTAIACGSTMVRIGTKIFGPRNYNL